MKTLLLSICVLLAVVASGQRIGFMVNGGYTSGIISDNGSSMYATKDIVNIRATRGYYISATGTLTGKEGAGVKLSVGYDQLDITTKSQSPYYSSGDKTASFATISPGFIYMPKAGRYNVMMGIDVQARLSNQNGYKNNISAGAFFGGGYKGVLLTVAYEHGLTNFIEAETFKGSTLNRRLSMFKVGISLMPLQWF